MDIDRLRTLAGTPTSQENGTEIFSESYDQATRDGIERNKGRVAKPVLGPNGNELKNTIMLSSRGTILGVRAAGGMTIVVYDELSETKTDIFLPDEAIDALGSVESL